MSIKCPNCEQDIAPDSPLTAAEVGLGVEEEGGWANLAYLYPRSTSRVIQARGKRVQLNVIEKIDPVDMPSNEYDRQGETYKAFLIVEVNGLYYRKEAHVDSYGDETWGGPVIRVNKVSKTVQVWE